MPSRAENVTGLKRATEAVTFHLLMEGVGERSVPQGSQIREDWWSVQK